jgi:hypothetical protein
VSQGAQPPGGNSESIRRTPLFAFARAAGWLIVPLYTAGMFANYWLENLLGLRDENSLEDVVLVAGFGAFAVVGVLVVVKRPSNPIGWILAAVALMVAVFSAGDSYAAYVMSTRGRPDVLAVLGLGPRAGTGTCSSRWSSSIFPCSSRMDDCCRAAGSGWLCRQG